MKDIVFRLSPNFSAIINTHLDVEADDLAMEKCNELDVLDIIAKNDDNGTFCEGDEDDRIKLHTNNGKR